MTDSGVGCFTLDGFRNPSSEYYGSPFWSWNGDLKPERLISQIRSMKAAGLGGFMCHSRVGLTTPYMEGDWLEAVRASVSEAKALGMKAWLYDEDSFPSGFAGGAVMDENPAYAARWLRAVRTGAAASEMPAGLRRALAPYMAGAGESGVGSSAALPSPPLGLPFDHEGLLAAYAMVDAAVRPGRGQAQAQAQGSPEGPVTWALVASGATPGGRLAIAEAVSSGRDLIVLYVEAMAPDPWHNGRPYVDLLNPEVTSTFLRLTHEVYLREFSAEFGRTIPGIFADEPHVKPGARCAVPWTGGFVEYLAAAKGSDPIPGLVGLFEETPNWRAARNAYWKAVSRRFMEAFCRPIYTWCEQHGLAFTGHYWEHEAADPTASGSIIAPLRYMQLPGIDLLGRDHPKHLQATLPAQVGNYAMVKTATSVANQFGTGRALSETYGGGNWDLDFAAQKRIAEWQAVIGINYMVQHLFLYSLLGGRKRDFPIAFNHEPWYRGYRVVADGLARLYYALSQGDYLGDVLVLHPMASIWLEHHLADAGSKGHAGNGAGLAQALAYSCDAVCKELAVLGFQFDLGDEVLMEDDSSVEPPAKPDSPPLLRVGSARYRAVVIPPVANLQSTTYALLRGFAARGGTVIVCGEPPQFVDGEPATDAAAWFAQSAKSVDGAPGSPVDIRQLEAALAPVAQRPARFVGALQATQAVADAAMNSAGTVARALPEVYCHARHLAHGSLYFVLNCGHAEAKGHLVFEGVDVTCLGGVTVLDTATGTDSTLAQLGWAQPEPDGAGSRAECLMGPAASLLLWVPEAGVPVSAPLSGAGALPWGSSRADAQPKLSARATGGFRRHDPNVLPLDTCRVRIGDGDWSESKPVWRAGVELSEAFGATGVWQRVYNSDMQWWRKWRETPPIHSDTMVRLCFAFKADAIPAGSLRLAVERGRDFEVAVNGRAVLPDGGWWLDPDVITYDIGRAAAVGSNEVTLGFTFREEMELEALHVVGDFGVWFGASEVTGNGPHVSLSEPSLGYEPRALPPGTWVGVGYPFYSGSITTDWEFDLPEDLASPSRAAILGLDALPAVVCEARVNGDPCGSIAWEPWESAPFMLRPGSNRIELKVTGSARNLMGPNHREAPPQPLMGSYTMVDGHHWTDAYTLREEGTPTGVYVRLLP